MLRSHMNAEEICIACLIKSVSAISVFPVFQSHHTFRQACLTHGAPFFLKMWNKKYTTVFSADNFEIKKKHFDIFQQVANWQWILYSA